MAIFQICRITRIILITDIEIVIFGYFFSYSQMSIDLQRTFKMSYTKKQKLFIFHNSEKYLLRISPCKIVL